MSIERLELDLNKKWDLLLQRLESIGQLSSRNVLMCLKPVCIIDNTIYIKYIGLKGDFDERVREETVKGYQNFRDIIESEIQKCFNIKYIVKSSKLSEEKLAWLKELITIYKPSSIEFSILRS